MEQNSVVGTDWPLVNEGLGQETGQFIRILCNVVNRTSVWEGLRHSITSAQFCILCCRLLKGKH